MYIYICGTDWIHVPLIDWGGDQNSGKNRQVSVQRHVQSSTEFLNSQGDCSSSILFGSDTYKCANTPVHFEHYCKYIIKKEYEIVVEGQV